MTTSYNNHTSPANMAKILTFVTLLFLLGFLLPTTASASEGIIRLSGTNPGTKCFALSTKLDSTTYRILADCRNLIYPPSGSFFRYIMWATPVNGDRMIRLGDLNYGKALFRASAPFSSLFVTAEGDSSPRTPSDRIVMRGDVEPNTFLDGEDAEVTELIVTPPPGEATPKPKSGLNFLGLVGRATLISLILFLLILGVVIFLIRRK